MRIADVSRFSLAEGFSRLNLENPSESAVGATVRGVRGARSFVRRFFISWQSVQVINHSGDVCIALGVVINADFFDLDISEMRSLRTI